MDLSKRIIIFMVVAFKQLIYIIDETITTSPIIIYGYLLFIIALSLPNILKIKFNKNSFIKVTIIFGISFFMFCIFKEDNVFLYSLLAIITLDEDTDKIVKEFYRSLCIIYLMTIALGYLGILPLNNSYRTIEGTTETRFSLGFANVNAVFTYFIPLFLAGNYLYKNKTKFNIVMVIIATILFVFSRSRTGYYLVLLIICCNILKKQNLVLKIVKNQFLFFFVISVLLALIFGRSKSNYINELLSYRPWYYLNFIKLTPIVWGKRYTSKFNFG